MEIKMKTNTKTLSALLSAVALFSANAALACGGGHSAGHSYSVSRNYEHEKPRSASVLPKRVASHTPAAPAPANVASNPAPIAPSLAASIEDSSF
jgi:hypothetical protein